MFLQKAIYALAFLLLIDPVCLAGDVSLAWDPSTSEDVTGYKMYVGLSSGSYERVDPLGNVTEYTVTGLAGGAEYYFAVTATDDAGNESGYSNEVHTFVPLEESLQVLSQAASTQWFGVVIQAQANKNSNAIIRYSPIGEDNWITIIASEDYFKTIHRVLIPMTYGQGERYYQYIWTITTESGETATAEGTFMVN
jgi:fibronectin type 3 domain-containing protein